MAPKKDIPYKGRILFLHGYTQSSSIFYAKTSALRKKLQKLQYKAIYLNGPFKLTPAQLPSNDALSKFSTVIADENEETNYRAWWVKNELDKVDITASIDSVKDYITNGTVIQDDETEAVSQEIIETDAKLPIVGLVGFSQGAAFASLLVHKFDQLFGIDTLKFAVMYSGFKLDTSKNSPNHHYDHLYTTDKGEDGKVKLLHVYGELDTVVSDDRALTFYEHSPNNSDLLKHPGGHFVPNSKLLIDQVTNWIQHTMSEETKSDKKDEDDLDALMDMMDNLGKA